MMPKDLQSPKNLRLDKITEENITKQVNEGRFSDRSEAIRFHLNKSMQMEKTISKEEYMEEINRITQRRDDLMKLYISAKTKDEIDAEWKRKEEENRKMMTELKDAEEMYYREPTPYTAEKICKEYPKNEMVLHLMAKWRFKK